MSGGAPVPVVVKEVILSIDDLEAAGSAKLTRLARGKFTICALRSLKNLCIALLWPNARRMLHVS